VRLLLAALGVVIAGCGASGTSGSVVTSTTIARQATSTTVALTVGPVHLGDNDSGTTVKVARGMTILVVLNSTYWQFATPAAPATVLAPVGSVVKSPAPIGSCVPGAGCGTVAATYQAVGTGQATISASRTTCGEALRCTGSAGSYQVTVVVTAR
jgi:hypothetical protein